jgi:hypothetical protein
MAFANGLDEEIELLAEVRQVFVQVLIEWLVHKRASFAQSVKVVDGFVVGGQGVSQPQNKVLLLFTSAIAFHDVRAHRFAGATNL